MRMRGVSFTKLKLLDRIIKIFRRVELYGRKSHVQHSVRAFCFECEVRHERQRVHYQHVIAGYGESSKNFRNGEQIELHARFDCGDKKIYRVDYQRGGKF